ncbi:amino acid permease [Fictibacillus barbaricus]|uniref:Arginine:ornithine antiporter/lysine permease n=1 Tax=Fictibacillus barbaricus TaxID=182136 RepID=A0ABU1TYZ3_9BACL|nr:amino acid permease [Fictibacillus barbaricus]MDR7072411.1 arginine:ornithine antiporter/lysine permease [Fictibacillus barbaricus]
MKNTGWSFWLLTAFVVGNMVGSGIFMLPSTLAQTASPLGVTAAWLVTGFGVLMIALVFGSLSIRRPDLTAGPQSYARALFSNPKAGNVAGFSMVWGYWVANWISNVAIITSFAGYLSTFFPIMKSNKIVANVLTQPIELGKLVTFIVCTALLWFTHFILVKSMNVAGKLNFIATASKVIGFMLFIAAALFAIESTLLANGYFEVVDSQGVAHGLGSQVKMGAIATLWAFVGIESAVVLSGRAASQRDVKKATIVGLLIALSIYMITTILTMNVLPREVLMASDKPFVDVLSALIGHTGASLMGLLAVISLFGSTIGWILLSSEVPYQAAKSGVFPAFFGKANKNGSPVNALSVTNIMSQIFIFSTISGTISEAYMFLTTSATLAYLIPYLISAIYFLKLVIKGETYDLMQGSRVRDGLIAMFAMIYSVWVIISGTADIKTFSLGMGLFLFGFIVYPLFNRFTAK